MLKAAPGALRSVILVQRLVSLDSRVPAGRNLPRGYRWAKSAAWVLGSGLAAIFVSMFINGALAVSWLYAK